MKKKRKKSGVFSLRLYHASIALVLAGIVEPAWAIPSPDLVIGLSASVAQVLGLLSVVFTGMAFSRDKSSRRLAQDNRSGRASKWRWFFRFSVFMLIASVGVNVFQYTSSVDDTNRRLQTNLVRSSVEAGMAVGDTSLKTLKLSDQIYHPNGIDNQVLSAWISQGRPLNLIDVRESEEVEMGSIAGTWHRRYPDLRNDASGLVEDGKETVLMCYSGNRSSELCSDFASKGIPCRFLVGGYEKWINDDLPIEFSKARTVEDLRSLPDYPNRDTLLDTPDVVEIVNADNALFVDVRYPEDFALGHLPGAINIPVRKMLSSELKQALEGLPMQPIITACYDKRSCFYSKIIGLQLSRIGFDYRGRYTVPHEYFIANKSAAAVETTSLLGWISGPLGAGLVWLSYLSGHLASGILLLVVVLRVFFFPFALKADRDRVVQKALAPEISALKQKITDDAQRLSRATMQLYRRARLTPVRNLASSIVQLALFLVFFSVVNATAKSMDQSFLWYPNMALPDPGYILPSIVSALFFSYIVMTVSRRSKLFMLMYCMAGALIWMLCHKLSVAVNVYLVVNISLLVLQSITFNTLHARNKRKSEAASVPMVVTSKKDLGVVSLEDAYKYPGAGNKAIKLSQLIKAGFPVPPGFVVTGRILNRKNSSDSVTGLELTRKEKILLGRYWRLLGAKKVAVRSSGLNEDGISQSYAGVFDTTLNVEKNKLVSALLTVRQSMCSERINSYAGNAEEKGGAVVQSMVDAQYAGVLFTEHPSSSGCLLIEMVSGLGESLVSGQVTPESYRFGVVSGSSLDDRKPPIDLAPLIALGHKVEKLFGKPQDIEWAYADGEFMLLQTRDITTSVHEHNSIEAAFEIERRKLLQYAPDIDPGEAFLVQNELSELLPRPTPLSASLMESLWSVGGSTDLACRSLGIPYDVGEDSSFYTTRVFGALYINSYEASRRLRRTPGPVAIFRLTRNAEAIESGFRDDFLPRFLNEISIPEALDFNRLSDREIWKLFQNWADQFIKETYVEAEIVNVATDFYWKTACTKLESRDIDPALYLGNIPQTVVHRAMSLLTQPDHPQQAIREFLDLFGHRAPQDYELSHPRYSESPEAVINQIACNKRSVSAPDMTGDLPSDPVLRLAVDRAKRFQVLKEDAKHHCLRQLALLRKVLVVLDERLDLNNGIFYLTLDEILDGEFLESLDAARETAAARMRDAKAWKDLRLPSELSINSLERMDYCAGVLGGNLPVNKNGVLKGKRVAGTGDIIGYVRVMHNPDDIKSLSPEDIVVARFTDPTWYTLFPIAKGIITEVGGWLSHAAIVAREHNLTAIVGVKTASEVLHTGDLVKLGADGTVEIIEDRRASNSLTRSTGNPEADGKTTAAEMPESAAMQSEAIES
ncbi:MAG: PEP/pyruvate-binding domain-containing protein [Gammaproteobacteria bacterium]